MAIFRKVHVSFWEDAFIASLTPERKYFFLYLLTNSKTTQCGIYELTIQKIVTETGYNQETVLKLLEYFEDEGKVKYSRKTSEVAIRNWVRFNGSSSPQVRARVSEELKLVKNRVLIEYLYCIDTTSQEDKEQDKEGEREKEGEKEPTQIELDVWPTFEHFWDMYDKKVDRPKCEKKWNKLTQGAREKIMFHVEAYVKSTADKTYRKHPYTYLYNQSWENEIIVNGKPTREKTHADHLADAAHYILRTAEADQSTTGQEDSTAKNQQ